MSLENEEVKMYIKLFTDMEWVAVFIPNWHNFWCGSNFWVGKQFYDTIQVHINLSYTILTILIFPVPHYHVAEDYFPSQNLTTPKYHCKLEKIHFCSLYMYSAWVYHRSINHLEGKLSFINIPWYLVFLSTNHCKK